MEILFPEQTANFKTITTMKYSRLLSILTILFLINSLDLHAQVIIDDGDSTIDNPIQTQPNGINLISCTTYEAITYNGHTVEQINASEGAISSVQSLWGSYTSVNENETSWERLYMFSSNKVAFNTELGRLTTVEITNNQWPVKILGKEIRVGDHFNELKQKFGSDIKIIYKPEIDPNYVVTFNCSENDYDGILIDIDTISNQVMEIIYSVNP